MKGKYYIYNNNYKININHSFNLEREFRSGGGGNHSVSAQRAKQKATKKGASRKQKHHRVILNSIANENTTNRRQVSTRTARAGGLDIKIKRTETPAPEWVEFEDFDFREF